MDQLIYKGTVVFTTSALADELKVDERLIKANYQRNECRYVEGEHFYVITKQEAAMWIDYVARSQKTDKVYLWTKQGVLNHIKSIGSNEAWSTFKTFVDTYIKMRSNAETTIKTQSQAEDESLIESDLIEISDFAKQINWGPLKLFKQLRDDNYLIKNGIKKNHPSAKYRNILFKLLKREFKNPKTEQNQIYYQTYVTQKGQEYFSAKYGVASKEQ